MLKKYLSKFAMDIFPSVAATIIGAYIVNHYIVTKPAADTPAVSAASTADPKADTPKANSKEASERAKAETKPEAKPSETSSDLANIPEAGVRAKGISENAVFDRSTAQKPVEKPADKVERPAETANTPSEPRRHQPALREKSVAKAVQAPVQQSVPAIAPAVTTPNPTPPVESAVAPDERRDANDLARAAIERLRGTSEGSPRAQETARTPDATRVPDASRIQDPARIVAAPPVRPLPPAIMVSTPTGELFDATASSQIKPPYTASARIDDPRRPTPPADIPASRPLDLHAEGSGPVTREHTSVAEDMLSAAKSVFHSVLPK